MEPCTSSKSEEWNSLETAIWTCIPLLGKNWMGKWKSSKDGFKIIITDGVFVWGESQTASYITEKANEWAPCIEGDIDPMSREILNQLSQELGILTCTKKNSSLLIIELSSCLEELPYSWIFNLKLVTSNVSHDHWIFPIVASMKFMELRVHMLERELKRRERQLKDLDPNFVSSDASLDNNNSLMATSTEFVFSIGIGRSLCENSYFSPHMLNAFYERIRYIENNKNEAVSTDQEDKFICDQDNKKNQVLEQVGSKCVKRKSTYLQRNIKKKIKKKLCI